MVDPDHITLTWLKLQLYFKYILEESNGRKLKASIISINSTV